MTILAIDQGTTSTRAIVFDADGVPTWLPRRQRELPQIYPRTGLGRARRRRRSGAPPSRRVRRRQRRRQVSMAAGHRIAANRHQQPARDHRLSWDRTSGVPMLHNAIVWQDRRTGDQCHPVCAPSGAAEAYDPGANRACMRRSRTFSASKLAWLLDNVHRRAGEAAEARRAWPSAPSTVSCYGG